LVGKRMGAMSLLTDKAMAYSDGYLYSIIRYGRGVMPRYGDKIFRFDERWAVVNYVRKLQGRAPTSQGAAQCALPNFASASSPGATPGATTCSSRWVWS